MSVYVWSKRFSAHRHRIIYQVESQKYLADICLHFIVADHSFLFGIFEKRTLTPLFWGRISRPSTTDGGNNVKCQCGTVGILECFLDVHDLAFFCDSLSSQTGNLSVHVMRFFFPSLYHNICMSKSWSICVLLSLRNGGEYLHGRSSSSCLWGGSSFSLWHFSQNCTSFPFLGQDSSSQRLLIWTTPVRVIRLPSAVEWGKMGGV